MLPTCCLHALVYLAAGEVSFDLCEVYGMEDDQIVLRIQLSGRFCHEDVTEDTPIKVLERERIHHLSKYPTLHTHTHTPASLEQHQIFSGEL